MQEVGYLQGAQALVVIGQDQTGIVSGIVFQVLAPDDLNHLVHKYVKGRLSSQMTVEDTGEAFELCCEPSKRRRAEQQRLS